MSDSADHIKASSTGSAEKLSTVNAIQGCTHTQLRLPLSLPFISPGSDSLLTALHASGIGDAAALLLKDIGAGSVSHGSMVCVCVCVCVSKINTPKSSNCHFKVRASGQKDKEREREKK